MERNSEHKIVMIVLAVLAARALGIDVAQLKMLIGNAQEINDAVQVATGVNISELGMAGVAIMYNWGKY